MTLIIAADASVTSPLEGRPPREIEKITLRQIEGKKRRQGNDSRKRTLCTAVEASSVAPSKRISRLLLEL